MKELSIEEKAKAYDEALKVLHKYDGANIMFTQNLKEEMFPELREVSEDERIRKGIESIIKHYKDEGEVVCPYPFVTIEEALAWLEKQGEQKPNPYSGTSFEYNGHTWGMCARDNGVEILIDGHIKGRVFTNDSNAKEMFIKALERVEEQNAKGYKLTDCDKNSWWEDFKAYTSCTVAQKPAEWSSEQSKTLQTDDVPNESSTAAPLRTGAIGFDGEPMESKPCEHNSVWSKEDEKTIINIGEYLNCYGNYIVDKNEEKAAKIYKSADWLKSLKERYTWKPSEGQMKALWNVYQGGKEQAELATLYNDLKKLRNE